MGARWPYPGWPTMLMRFWRPGCRAKRVATRLPRPCSAKSTPAPSSAESVVISWEVANTASVAGEEVVQLYVRDEVASLPRPVKQLMGYARGALQPGERKTIRFALPVNQLAFTSSAMTLVIEPGRIQVMIGSSSDDIRLQGAFEIVGPAVMTIE